MRCSRQQSTASWRGSRPGAGAHEHPAVINHYAGSPQHGNMGTGPTSWRASGSGSGAGCRSWRAVLARAQVQPGGPSDDILIAGIAYRWITRRPALCRQRRSTACSTSGASCARAVGARAPLAGADEFQPDAGDRLQHLPRWTSGRRAASRGASGARLVHEIHDLWPGLAGGAESGMSPATPSSRCARRPRERRPPRQRRSCRLMLPRSGCAVTCTRQWTCLELQLSCPAASCRRKWQSASAPLAEPLLLAIPQRRRAAGRLLVCVCRRLAQQTEMRWTCCSTPPNSPPGAPFALLRCWWAAAGDEVPGCSTEWPNEGLSNVAMFDADATPVEAQIPETLLRREPTSPYRLEAPAVYRFRHRHRSKLMDYAVARRAEVPCRPVGGRQRPVRLKPAARLTVAPESPQALVAGSLRQLGALSAGARRAMGEARPVRFVVAAPHLPELLAQRLPGADRVRERARRDRRGIGAARHTRLAASRRSPYHPAARRRDSPALPQRRQRALRALLSLSTGCTDPAAAPSRPR